MPNEPSIAELQAQVTNLEAQVYTLKANIESLIGATRLLPNFTKSDPVTLELLNMLGRWAAFDLPGSPGNGIAESGQSGT